MTTRPTRLEFPFDLDAEIARNVAAALSEDIGAGDLTAELVPAANHSIATVIVREPAVVCGIDWFNRCFAEIDPTITVTWHVNEGEHVGPDTLLCELQGASRALLSGERAALNFLQLLSGLATRAATFVDTIAGTKAQIVDTRKTIPGLRFAQKYAVRVGGGGNHRLALWDAILIKENHIMAAGGIHEAVRRAWEGTHHLMRIGVEVEDLGQFDEALEAGADVILMDNMSNEDMREAVGRATGRKVILEASGNATLDRIRSMAETGVHFISVGALTHSAPSIDLTLLIENSGS